MAKNTVALPHKSVEVYGYRWFQSTYGNTYHTVIVFADGVEVYRSDISYGYGEQFQETAKVGYLSALNLSPKLADGYRSFGNFCTDAGVKYYSKVTDVKRKKDLLAFVPFG